MDIQLAFNIAIGLISFLGGWILNSLTKKLETQDVALISIRDKVQAIEVVMAGTYVKREDLEKVGDALLTKLEQISVKLDTKQDKQ